MDNLNLCEILKGHEGENFYSALHGFYFTLYKVTTNLLIIRNLDKGYSAVTLAKTGAFFLNGECILFPSKEQRSWVEWDKENNHKTAKTWSEIVEKRDYIGMRVNIDYITQDIKTISECGSTPIERSALAFLKIHQLIQAGYGGNITNEEWENQENTKWIIGFNDDFSTFSIDFIHTPSYWTHIAFHTKKQAEDFLSYPENVNLLKDYFMI